MYKPQCEIKAGKKEFGNSGAYQALRFWTDSRVYPAEKNPDIKYQKAYEEEKVGARCAVEKPHPGVTIYVAEERSRIGVTNTY